MNFGINAMINEVEMVPKICPSCGAIYAIPRIMNYYKHENGGEWCCPNGHSITTLETKADQLEKRNQELVKELKEANRKKSALCKEVAQLLVRLEKRKKPKKKTK